MRAKRIYTLGGWRVEFVNAGTRWYFL